MICPTCLTVIPQDPKKLAKVRSYCNQACYRVSKKRAEITRVAKNYRKV